MQDRRSLFAEYLEQEVIQEQLATNINYKVKHAFNMEEGGKTQIGLSPSHSGLEDDGADSSGLEDDGADSDSEDIDRSGYISRFFNGFIKDDLDFPAFAPLNAAFGLAIGSLDEAAIRANSPALKVWLNFAIAIACDNLFDENGNLRAEVEEILNRPIEIEVGKDKRKVTVRPIDELKKDYTDAQINRQLLSSFRLMINESVAPTIAARFPFNPYAVNEEGDPLLPLPRVFADKLDIFLNEIPTVGGEQLVIKAGPVFLGGKPVMIGGEPQLKEYIDSINKELRQAILKPDFAPKELKEPLLEYLEPRYPGIRQQLPQPFNWKTAAWIVGGIVVTLLLIAAAATAIAFTYGGALPIVIGVGTAILAGTGIGTSVTAATVVGAAFLVGIATTVGVSVGGMLGYGAKKTWDLIQYITPQPVKDAINSFFSFSWLKRKSNNQDAPRDEDPDRGPGPDAGAGAEAAPVLDGSDKESAEDERTLSSENTISASPPREGSEVAVGEKEEDVHVRNEGEKEEEIRYVKGILPTHSIVGSRPSSPVLEQREVKDNGLTPPTNGQKRGK